MISTKPVTNSLIFIMTLLSIQYLTACSSHKTMPDRLATEQMNALSRQPMNSTEITIFRQALEALKDNDATEAESVLHKLVALNPELASPWANLGLIYHNQNKLDKAHQAVSQAVKYNPSMPQALNLLGLISLKQGKVQEAETLYLKAIQSKQDYANAHYNLALLYDTYLQQLDKAISHYERYLEITKYSDEQTMDWLQQLKSTLSEG